MILKLRAELVQSTKLLGHYYKQGFQAVSLGASLLQDYSFFFLTITRNPHIPGILFIQAQRNHMILAGASQQAGTSVYFLSKCSYWLEHLFTFSLHSLTLSSSHQSRASEETISLICLSQTEWRWGKKWSLKKYLKLNKWLKNIIKTTLHWYRHNTANLKISLQGNNIKKDIPKLVGLNGGIKAGKEELKMSKGREDSRIEQRFRVLILGFPLVLGFPAFLVSGSWDSSFPPNLVLR